MRFCRKCGHPTGMLEDASTRLLDSTPPVGAPTTVLNSGATGPAFVEPEPQPKQAAPSQPIKQAPSAPVQFVPPIQPQPPVQASPPAPPARKSSGLLIFLIGGFVLIVAVIGCLVIWKMSTTATTSESQNSSSTPQAPAPPTTTPPPSSNGSGGSEKGSMVYPGARVNMSASESGNSFSQYLTKDSVDKVVEWYRSRMNHPAIIRPASGGVTLTSGSTTVIIAGQGGETVIMIAQQ
ncbi:MAG TPA: hypothetical protein VFC63_24130 [Blastocatellia bacterium]|nr:hypothetical protein [Blastocatellia bacterium]